MDLGKAFVQIVPSAQGIQGSITNALKGEASTAGTSAGGQIAGKLKGAILKAGIGATVGIAVKKSLEAGGALQQSFGGLETIYGDAAAAAKGYAKEAYKAGISTNDYAEQAVSFGAALKQAYEGDTAKAVEAANTAILDMTDNAAKMGTPIENIQNAYQGFAKQNYTMLDNLKLGYGGTKAEMERLLEDATKLSGQEYDISNLGDVYDAIHVIQEDLGLTGVAAMEASETFTGSFQAMAAAGQNLLGALSLGQDVAPTMSAFVTSVVTFVGNNLIPMLGNILQSLPTAIMTAIETATPMVISAGQNLISMLSDGVTTGIPTVLEKAQQIIPQLAAYITARLPQILETGKNIVVRLFSGFMSMLPQLYTMVGQIIPQIGNFLQTNIPVIAEKGAEMVKQLAQTFVANIPEIISAAGRLMVTIVKTLIKLAPTILSAALKIVGALVSGLTGGAIAKVKAAAAKIRDAILSPIRAAVAKVQFTVRKIRDHLSFSGLSAKVKGAFDRIKNAIFSPIDSAKEKVRNAINKIKGLFPLSIGKIFSNLSLPHISVKGGKAPFGIGGKGSLPSFSVNWHAKAMEQPYLFSGATLFGAGEAGDEMLYGRNALMNDIRDAVSGRAGVTNNFYITADGTESPEAFADRLVKRVKMEMRTI